MSTYERIAVVTNPAIDDPAVAVAAQLGARVGALELISVSPNRALARVNRARLERLAAMHGWTPAACTVLVGDDATAIVRRHLSRRRRTLCIVAGAGLVHSRDRDTATGVLATAQGPILVCGSHVDPLNPADLGTLLVIAGTATPDPTTLDAIETWVATFGSDVGLLRVVAECPEGADSIDPWVAALASRGLLSARWATPALDPVAAAGALSPGAGNAFIMVPPAAADPATLSTIVEHPRSPVVFLAGAVRGNDDVQSTIRHCVSTGTAR